MELMRDVLNQVPQLVRSTDPSTIVGVTQIEGAIQDWECERLRNFIKRQFESRYRQILSSPTSSRVMHPRAERGNNVMTNETKKFLSNNSTVGHNNNGVTIYFMTMRVNLDNICIEFDAMLNH